MRAVRGGSYVKQYPGDFLTEDILTRRTVVGKALVLLITLLNSNF